MKKFTSVFCCFFILGLGVLAQDAPVSATGNVITGENTAVVPVTVKNFTNIAACNIKIGFNAGLVSLTSVTAGPGITPAGVLNYNISVPGEVYFQWYGSPAASLPDDGVLFNLHFSKVAPGTSPLIFMHDAERFYSTFTHFPSFVYLNDSPKNNFFTDGSLTFTHEGTAPATAIPHRQACTGQTVEFPVTVTGFNSIGSVSLFIRYDKNVLANPLFYNTSNTIPLSFTLQEEGVITVSGESDNPGGHTLPDSSAFFTLSFTYMGGTSDIYFHHDSETNCQYGGPTPYFTPLGDEPPELFFTGGSVSPAALPEVTCPGNFSLCCTGEPVIPAAFEGITPADGIFFLNGEPVETFTPDCQNPNDYIFTYLYTDPETFCENSCEFTLTVYDEFIPGAIAASGETICCNTSPGIEITSTTDASGGDRNIAYIWQKSTIGFSEGFAGIEGATAATYTPDGPLTQTTWYRRMAGDGLCNTEHTASVGVWQVTVDVCSVEVEGKYRYLNHELTPLKNVTVQLKKESEVVYTAATGEYGSYFFPSVKSGDYEVVSVTGESAGEAVNSLDAGLVLAWSAGPRYSIEKVRFKAGDVGYNGSLNAADADAINLRFLNGETEGLPWNNPVGLWSFWKAGETVSQNNFTGGLNPIITIGATPVTHDFYGLVTGDFNLGFTPGIQSAGSVIFDNTSVIAATPEEEVVIPFIAGSDMTVRAFSLLLGYPHNRLEIEGVFLEGDPAKPIPWNIVNNHLRIGWFDGNSTSVDSGETLFQVKVKTAPETVAGEELYFTLVPWPLNELGDENFQVISNATLYASKIELKSSETNKPEYANQFTFTPYPNPASGSATLSYTLPAEGKVSFGIYTILGSKVAEMNGQTQPAGSYTSEVDIREWSSGIYFLKIKLYINSSNIYLLRKMVIQ